MTRAADLRPETDKPTRRPGFGIILVALAATDFSFAFQQTGVVPALPTVEADLHASPEWTAWLLTGYLMLAAGGAPLFGKLGDRHGKRRMLVIALVLYLVGAAGAAAAPNIAALICFRALQGVGGGIFPLSLSILRDEAPPGRLGQAIGLLVGFFGLGAAAGFGLSGVLVEAVSWRLIFGVGAVVVAVATYLTHRLIPDSPDTSGRRSDLPGAALLWVALMALLISLTEGTRVGWLSPEIIGGFVVAVALLAVWVRRELRTAEPLLDVRVLSRRPVLLTNLATAASGFVAFTVYELVPHLVEAPRHAPPALTGQIHYGFAASALGAGLLILPAGIGELLAGPTTGGLARRYGAKWPFVAGMVLMAAGPAVLAGRHAQKWTVVAGMLLLGLGFGAAIGCAGSVITQSVPRQDTGVSTAFNSVVRLVGGGIGGQVAAAVLAAYALVPQGPPSEAAYTVGLSAAAGVAGAGALAALLLPRRTLADSD